MLTLSGDNALGMERFLKILYKALLILSFCSIPLGFFSLVNSYYLSTRDFCIDSSQIISVGPIKIDKEIIQLFPEFFSRTKEDLWWKKQKELFEFLKNHGTAQGIINKDGRRSKIQLFIHKLEIRDVFRKTALIYLCVIIYLISAILIKKKHSKYNFALPAAIFLVSAALYLSSTAPLAGRQLTLHPFYYKLLIWLNYIAGGFIISLIHFALLFPKPKKIVIQYPHLLWIPYAYAFIVTAFYFSGITAFDSSLPFFFFWTTILIWAFGDSVTREKDPLIKKQIQLVLFAPLFLSAIFIFLHIVPLATGREILSFSTFAIFSLIMPFALPLALDNVELQLDKMKMEKLLQEELEDVRRTLHDFILRKFSFISVYSQNIIRKSGKQNVIKVIDGVKQIHKEAGHVSHDLRFFLNLLNTQCDIWHDYLAKLRYYARKILKPSNIEVQIDGSEDLLKQNIAPLKVQSELFWILSEALANIVIHSGASKVKVLFSMNNKNITVKIIDNGKGLSKSDLKSSHLGFKNILKHASNINGNVKVFSKQDVGTIIEVKVPKHGTYTIN